MVVSLTVFFDQWRGDERPALQASSSWSVFGSQGPSRCSSKASRAVRNRWVFSERSRVASLTMKRAASADRFPTFKGCGVHSGRPPDLSDFQVTVSPICLPCRPFRQGGRHAFMSVTLVEWIPVPVVTYDAKKGAPEFSRVFGRAPPVVTSEEGAS